MASFFFLKWRQKENKTAATFGRKVFGVLLGKGAAGVSRGFSPSSKKFGTCTYYKGGGDAACLEEES